MVLERLEQDSKRPVHEMFDLVCGTSTGGLIALATVVGRKSAADLRKLYERDGKDIFPDLHWTTKAWRLTVSKGHRYKNTGLKEIAQRLLLSPNGQSQLALHAESEPACRCFVVSSKVTTTPPQPFLFRNYAVDHKDPHLDQGTNQCFAWEAALATSAAPTYLPQVRLELTSEATINDKFEDGGYMANNPAMQAFKEVKRLFPNRSVGVVVSIGTGQPSIQAVPAPSTGLGQVKQQVLDHIVAAATNGELVHKNIASLLDNANVPYYRLNPEGGVGDVDLAGTSVKDISRLRDATGQYLHQPDTAQKLKNIVKLVQAV